ncbi:hypothetical protein LSAT2_017282 [Lamellibrachia satsuma]|nr:hypothetical protein LSAT2_017282 [Lamellibrachia satsuma]
MTSPSSKKDVDLLSVQHSTIYEEDTPVIVRRRGCTLRVRLGSMPNEHVISSPIKIPSDYGATAATPASSAPPFLRHKAKDDMSMGLCKSLRLLHRTFSDEVKHRRRDSMPASLLSCSQLALHTGHSDQGSNLMRMRGCFLGQSAPSLSASMVSLSVTSRE